MIVKKIKNRKGKYGRYLAEILITDENGGLINVNDLLVDKGFAVYMEYQRRGELVKGEEYGCL